MANNYLGCLFLTLFVGVSFVHGHKILHGTHTGGTGTSSSSSSGGTKSYTVSSEFYDFLAEARAGGATVRPKITGHSDGTYSISITTSKGTRELKNITKSSVDLFAQLFTNPNLKISVVSKSGSDVTISVSEESGGSAYTYSSSSSSSGGTKSYTVSSEFYDFLAEARDGGASVRPKITGHSDGTYSISITTSKGTRELKNISKSSVDLFAQLFTNPNLNISVVSKSGSDVTISVSEGSGGSAYTYSPSSSSSGGVKSYTVSSEFYDFLTEARGGGENVKPTITSNSDGTYTISITTSKGTRELKSLKKSTVDLFVQLFTNPNLKITIVSKSGSDVTISVSEESGGSAYTYSSSFSSGGGTKDYTVTSEFYDFITEARAGGVNVKPKITTNSDGTYTISITTSKGTRELKNVSKDIVDLFAQLFTNPNLKISVVSRTGSNVNISVTEESGDSSSSYTTSGNVVGSGTVSRDGSQEVKTYTVPVDFYDFIIEARDGGANVKPKITTNSDGTYTITITTSKGTRELKNISKNLVDLFAQLFTNPGFKITVDSKSGSNVKFSVSEDVESDGSSSVQLNSETIQLIKDLQTNPDLKLTHVSEKNGVYTLTFSDKGKTRTIAGIPSKAAKLIIYKAQHPNAKININKSGKSSIPITSTTTPRTTYTIGPKFLEAYNFVKKNPTSQIKVKQETDDSYTLTITFDGKTKTYRNVDLNLAQLLIFLFKNPKLDFKVSPQSDGKYKIVLPKNADNTPTTSAIPKDFALKLKKILDNPKIKVKIEEPKTGEYQLVVDDGSDKKTYKVPKSLIPVIEKLLKFPKGRDGKPNYHLLSKDGKNPHISLDTEPETSTHPVDKNFVTFIKKLEKNPDSAKHVTYNIQPTKDNSYDITVTLDSKKYVFKNLPHNIVQFFINFVNKPKDTPHTITEHDTPEHKHGKPHLTKDVPHEKPHLTKDVPQGKPHLTQDEPHKKTHWTKYVHHGKPHLTTDVPHEKPHLTKDVPHEKPHVTKDVPHEKPHLTKDVPHEKPHLTKDVPHTPRHTLTVDQPVGDEEIPLKIKDATKHEPSTTKFPSTHEDKPVHHKPSEVAIDEPRHHRPTEKDGHPKPTEKDGQPKPTEKDGHPKPTEKDGHPKPTEKDGHPKPTEKDGHPKPIEKDGHPKPTEKDGHPKPTEEDGNPKPTEKDGHPKPTSKKPISNTHEERRVYHPKEHKPSTLDLLNTVKNSPHLKISVKPKQPGHYDIVVDDGVHKTTYPDIPVKTLTGLIKVRNNKNLPFEILPSHKPGHVNVKVPDGNSPDTKRFSVSPDILEVTDAIKNPKTELKITPDKNGHFTVTTKKDGKEHQLKDLPSDAVETLVRLRSDDTLPFNIKPGKDGKLDLLVPKQHPKPVKTKLTPNILDLIGRVKKNPHLTFNLLPGKKPNTFTIELKDGSKTKTYPDITIDLIPILSQLYLTPNVDFEIKPTKDGSIEFLPSHSNPDDHYFEIPNRVFDIISSIRSKPSTTLKIEPTKHHDYSVIVTDDGHSKTYDNIKPDDVRLIVDLLANDNLPFSVKPNEHGVTLIVPKTDDTKRKVAIDPTTKKIVQEIRKHRNPHVTIEPDTDGQFTVTIGDKKYKHISPSLLELIITLVTKPDLNFKLEPEADGSMSVVVPKESPQTTQVKIKSDKVQFINDLRKKPVDHIKLKRDKEGYFDIDFDTPEGKKTLKHIKPNAGQFLVDVVTNPRLPFYIYSEDDDYKLVIPKRPSEPKFTNLPKNVLDFLIKEVKNPHLSLEITPHHEKPGKFDVDFSIDGKKIKHFPDLDSDTIEFINILFSHPDTKIETERDRDGTEVIVLKQLNSPTTDYTISQTVVKLLKDVANPTINSASVKHGKPGTFDLTLGYTSGTKRTFSGIKKLFFEPIFLILTKRNTHFRFYVDANGKFRVAIPKGAVTPNNFKVQPEFFDFLTKIQPEIPSLSFTLTTDKDDYDLFITTKSYKKTFKKLPSSTIELFIQFLLHPESKVDVKKEKDYYEVHQIRTVLKKGANRVVFKNVKSKFIHLINDLQKKPGNSITIQRKGDLTLLLGYGVKGLQFDHFQPEIVIELLISIFANPHFRYSTKIGADGTYTLIAHNLKRDFEFHSLNAKIRAKGSQLTASSDSLVLITRDTNRKLILATSVNRGSAEELKDIDIETVIYIALSTIYKNLHFQEKKTASGDIIYVKLPALKRDYDLTEYKVHTRVVADISKSFGGIFGKIFGWLGSLVSGVAKGANTVVSGIEHAASNVLGSVSSEVEHAIESVRKSIASVVGGDKHAVGGLCHC